MSKIHGSSCFAVCVLASILLNIFFIANLYGGSGERSKQLMISWSEKAAAEAEAVAAIACSGHGRAYLDGVFVDGRPACECNACFYGPDCSQFDLNCAADATSGDPLFLEPFWLQNAESSAIVVAGWHRMSYVFNDYSFISPQLEKQIRKLHAISKNANTDGKYIIFGPGSSQLLNAAVYALSMDNSSFAAKVVAASPYYPIYRDQTNFFQTAHYEFEGDATLLRNSSSDTTTNIIEFVNSPNNPDGQLKEAVLQGNTIHDHAYYWPHYTAIPAPADEDIMIFTLSKLTGHAGSRFGWAITKDKNIYEKMNFYISIAEMGVSKDSQLRALKLLQVVLEAGDGRDIFNFAYQEMTTRWEKVSRIISTSKRFSLQEISSQYCTYFQKVREPSPAYAWLKCEMDEDTDCYEVLNAANMIGRKGSRYGADDRYVRLSLLKRRDDFDLLLHRLEELVSKERAAKDM